MVFEMTTSREPEFINIYFITEAATRILFQTAAWAKKVQVGALWNALIGPDVRICDLWNALIGQQGSGMF
jgi:hypothetical protein